MKRSSGRSGDLFALLAGKDKRTIMCGLFMYPSSQGQSRIVYSTEKWMLAGYLPLPIQMRILQRKGIRMKKTIVSRPTRPSVHASRPQTRASARATTRNVSPRKQQPARLKQKRNRYARDTFRDSDIISSRSAGINGLMGGADEASAALPAAQEAAAPAGGNERGIGSLLGGFGGFDGIISMMTKAQQMFKLFQQMGPIFKLIGSFSGAKATTASVRTSRGTKAMRSRKGRR